MHVHTIQQGRFLDTMNFRDAEILKSPQNLMHVILSYQLLQNGPNLGTMEGNQRYGQEAQVGSIL